MSLENIFLSITEEMTRALTLQDAGKITRTPLDPKSTDIESANTLNEEVSEVAVEVIALIAAIQGLQAYAGKAIRTVNDLEQVLFSWRLSPPEQMDETDRNHVRLLRSNLKIELTQVAAVVTAWLLRLEDEEFRRLHDLRRGATSQCL